MDLNKQHGCILHSISLLVLLSTPILQQGGCRCRRRRRPAGSGSGSWSHNIKTPNVQDGRILVNEKDSFANEKGRRSGRVQECILFLAASPDQLPEYYLATQTSLQIRIYD
jgi:hypothetical protein